MANICDHFSFLHRRFAELSLEFLDDQIANEALDAANFQPNIDRLAAFRLLIHAEIEFFLETKAREGLGKIEASLDSGLDWLNNCYILYILTLISKEIRILTDLGDLQKIVILAKKTVKDAQEKISDNNGIKEQSFLFLSLCSGRRINDVDSVLLSGLNSYGVNRGDVAHTSATRVRNLQAPSIEKSTAENLIKLLSIHFDLAI